MNAPAIAPSVLKQMRTSDALLAQISALAGGAGAMIMHAQKPWASITYNGTRHELVWAFDGPQAIAKGEALIAALPDHEFSIQPQFREVRQVHAGGSLPVAATNSLTIKGKG